MAKDRVYEFSAPGRVEISGNHTDHQHGRVLAAAIDLTTNASVCKNDDEVIRVFSQGYDPVEVYIHYLELHEAEKNTTVALVRGVSAAFVQRGCPIGGFDARISSTVLPGSGLSSSAAFEVLMGRIINGLYFENRLSPVEIAQIGQYAENVYFGKPCGLMDQTASSVGGMVYIDFKNTQAPIVERVEYDFGGCGYTLCIVDSSAGKTRFYAKPNIMQANTSYVVLDPKGEILRDIGYLLEWHGYNIKVLDLIHTERSHGFNPFVYLRDDKDVLRLVNNLIRNTTPKGAQSSDPFWERAETALLEALILYLVNEAPPEEQNFSMVMEMINAAEVREDDEEYASVLDELFERLAMRDPEHLAVKQYHIFKLAAGDICSK